MKRKTNKPIECLNCPYPDCTNCIERKKSREKNIKNCKTYYQQHKKEMIARTLRNRYKKRIEERGYEMALYI